MRELRMAFRVLHQALDVLAWILTTTWLGVRILHRAWVAADRSHVFLSQVARCPRGHRVALYGVHRCASCRATLEGYVFRPCRHCGSTPAWTPCPRCHLSVPNPLR
jgi:hypothetical protein